jgi:hypothetical protein
VLLDPGEGGHRRFLEVTYERVVVGPAPDLGEEDQVQRRGVDRAVVALEPVLRSLAAPDLVHDLARLGVDRLVVLGRLKVGEDLERAAGELRAEEQGLETRDQRVAAEDGHEPRHAGRREVAEAVASAQPERGEVGHRAREDVVEVVPGRAQPRDPKVPGRERGLDPLALLAEALPHHVWPHRVAPQHRDNVEAELPCLPRLELDPIPDLPGLDVTALGQDHLRAGKAGVVVEHELVLLLLVASLCRQRQGDRLERVAEREVVVLDREDVREVARELEGELERDLLLALVLDAEVVLHSLADEAVPADRDAVLGKVAGDRVPEEVGGGVVLGAAGGEE